MYKTMLICIFISVLFMVVITKADSEVDNGTKKATESCTCIEYNCGCCQHIELDEIGVKGILCINASYLDKDYGIAVTMVYNNFTIINETVSARNPPPICIGEDLIDYVQVDICLRIYDIDISSDKFHACFQLLGRLMKIHLPSIYLGCFNQGISKHIFQNTSNDEIIEIEQQPNVIMI